MKLFNRLNEEEQITIVLVTHESDIAAYAERLVQFLDGGVVYDGAVKERLAERA
jgi:putative ABC transport system ATP-binding protein